MHNGGRIAHILELELTFTLRFRRESPRPGLWLYVPLPSLLFTSGHAQPSSVHYKG